MDGGNSQTFSPVKHQVSCWSHVLLRSCYPALCQFLHDKTFLYIPVSESLLLIILPSLALSESLLWCLPPNSSSFQVYIPTILSHSLELSHHYLPETKCPIHPNLCLLVIRNFPDANYSRDLSQFRDLRGSQVPVLP